jgi:hypothetical protein
MRTQKVTTRICDKFRLFKECLIKLFLMCGLNGCFKKSIVLLSYSIVDSYMNIMLSWETTVNECHNVLELIF